MQPMKTSTLALPRQILSGLGVLAALLALFFTGCVSVVPVTSDPSGASVTIAGKSIGSTPTQWQAEGGKAVDVEFALDGYFPESVSYSPGAQTSISASLSPSHMAKSFEVTSDPAGAAVTLNGTAVGTTPVTVPVDFKRANKNAQWIPQRLALAKPNYQAETVTLTSSLASVPTVAMSLLKDERVYSITATNLEGAPISAVITLDGKVVGKYEGTTAFRLPKTYERSDKSKPWPKFSLVVDLPGKYKPVKTELTYELGTTIALKLDAITEIVTKNYIPEVVIKPEGAVYDFTERAAVATLRTSDDLNTSAELKRVTQLDRQDMLPADRVDTISGFTVTPDGQSVIYAQTSVDESGHHYSTLYMKRADDSGGGISPLTRGTRYSDAQPFIVSDGEDNLVFISNRGDRSKPDVYLAKLAEGRLQPATRLTSDSRFNYYPTYCDSHHLLYYLSAEASYPKAEPQISSIRFEGVGVIQLPMVAEQINSARASTEPPIPERIYYVKTDADTKKKQISWIKIDGSSETPLITQEEYLKSNCFQPSVSTDGKRVLFVSDHTADKKDRPNNDIYVVDYDGNKLQRLTDNESDDTNPMWSPTEDGVIYFLSNRGGATNIWRAKLVSGR